MGGREDRANENSVQGQLVRLLHSGLNTGKDRRKEDQLQRPPHPGTLKVHLQVKDLVAYVLNCSLLINGKS